MIPPPVAAGAVPDTRRFGAPVVMIGRPVILPTFSDAEAVVVAVAHPVHRGVGSVSIRSAGAFR